MPRITARDSAKSGDVDLCRLGEPRSHSFSDGDPTAVIGIASGAVLKGQELAQIAVGVSKFAEAVLGSAFMGTRVLGSDQRECDG